MHNPQSQFPRLGVGTATAVILRNKLGKIVRTVLNKCKKIVRKGLIDEVELSEVGRQ